VGTAEPQIGGGLVSIPDRILAAELARIRNRHPHIEQDTLPHTAPHEDADTEEVTDVDASR